MTKICNVVAVVAAAIATLLSTGAYAQKAKLIVATLSTPESMITTKFYVPWAVRVQEQSQGALDMDVRHGFAIANLNNSLDRLKNNVVQITGVIPASFRGSFPLFEVGGLPYLSKNAEDAAVALWRLVKSGLLDDELKDVHVIATSTFGYSGIHFAKAPRSLDDLRGLKIVTASQIQSEMLSLLGAAPGTMTPMDAYPALQRGTFDGVMTSWSGLLNFKLDEVTTAHLEAPLGTTAQMVVMMRSQYNALPEAARKAIDNNSGEAWSRVLAREGVDFFIAEGRARTVAKGHQLVELTPAQLESWREKTKPVVDAWIKERPNGAKVIEAFRGHLEAVRAGR